MLGVVDVSDDPKAPNSWSEMSIVSMVAKIIIKLLSALSKDYARKIIVFKTSKDFRLGLMEFLGRIETRYGLLLFLFFTGSNTRRRTSRRRRPCSSNQHCIFKQSSQPGSRTDKGATETAKANKNNNNLLSCDML